MTLPLSEDLRRRIVAAYRRGGGTYEKLAAQFDVGRASVSRLLRQMREEGNVRPRGHGGGQPPSISEEQYVHLRKLVAEQPDRTVVQLCFEWKLRFGDEISRSAMQRALHRAGLTFKKNVSGRRSSSDRTSRKSGGGSRSSQRRWT